MTMKGVESPKKCEPVPSWFITGRIENGFDFLGYHFSPEGLSAAEKTIEKFLAHAVRLYEQEQGEPFGSPCLVCPEVASLVDTECEIKEYFCHDTLV